MSLYVVAWNVWEKVGRAAKTAGGGGGGGGGEMLNCEGAMTTAHV